MIVLFGMNDRHKKKRIGKQPRLMVNLPLDLHLITFTINQV